jgi:uncharacterized membrane protein HdeD (DUF308 family)
MGCFKNGEKEVAMRHLFAESAHLLLNWWSVVLRGVLAVLFGITALAAPRISFVALVAAFGLYALVDGVITLISAFRHRAADTPRWHPVLEGAAGIVVGALTLFWPGITALALVYLVAAWALVSGALKIVAAVKLRKAIHGEWLLALAGVATLALGVFLFVRPAAGALALTIWFGAYALIFGVTLIGLGLRIRSWRKAHIPEVEMRGTQGPFGTAGAH